MNSKQKKKKNRKWSQVQTRRGSKVMIHNTVDEKKNCQIGNFFLDEWYKLNKNF